MHLLVVQRDYMSLGVDLYQGSREQQGCGRSGAEHRRQYCLEDRALGCLARTWYQCGWGLDVLYHGFRAEVGHPA